MKTKLYFIMSLMVLILTGCSDDNNDKEEETVPEYSKGYVSRIKVSNLANPSDEVKTIKFYYDSSRRVTGVHWGTTVPKRSAWKFVYGSDKINFAFSGDPVESVRYCTFDDGGRASQMFYEAQGVSLNTVYSYADNRLVNLSESSENSIGSSTDFSWNMYGFTGAVTKVNRMNNDSLTITSSVIYDEFAPNNTNIDINVILNAVNGIIPHFSDAPMLLGICGSKPSQLVLRHSQLYEYANAPENNLERGYKVVNYSLQQGRIVKIETENEKENKYLRIDVVYKAD